MDSSSGGISLLRERRDRLYQDGSYGRRVLVMTEQLLENAVAALVGLQQL